MTKEVDTDISYALGLLTFRGGGRSTCTFSSPVWRRRTVALWCSQICCGEEQSLGGGTDPSPTNDRSVSGRKLDVQLLPVLYLQDQRDQDYASGNH